MKKLTKSMKIILISAISAVCVVGIVLGCVFGFKKSDPNSPAGPNNPGGTVTPVIEKPLTWEEQVALLGKEINDGKLNALPDYSLIQGIPYENYVDDENILTNFTQNYFVITDSNNRQNLYFYSVNSNGNFNITKVNDKKSKGGFGDNNAESIFLLKYNENYVVLENTFTDGTSNAIFLQIQSGTLNQVYNLEIPNKSFIDGEIEFSDNNKYAYVKISRMDDKESRIELTSLCVIDLNQNISAKTNEYEREEFKNLNINLQNDGVLIIDGNEITFYSFVNENFIYTKFEKPSTKNFSEFIQLSPTKYVIEFDSKSTDVTDSKAVFDDLTSLYYSYEYKVISKDLDSNNIVISNYELDENVAKLDFESVDETLNFYSIKETFVENNRKTEAGQISYYYKTNELVLKYEMQNENDYVIYSNSDLSVLTRFGILKFTSNNEYIQLKYFNNETNGLYSKYIYNDTILFVDYENELSTESSINISFLDMNGDIISNGQNFDFNQDGGPKPIFLKNGMLINNIENKFLKVNFTLNTYYEISDISFDNLMFEKIFELGYDLYLQKNDKNYNLKNISGETLLSNINSFEFMDLGNSILIICNLENSTRKIMMLNNISLSMIENVEFNEKEDEVDSLVSKGKLTNTVTPYGHGFLGCLNTLYIEYRTYNTDPYTTEHTEDWWGKGRNWIDGTNHGGCPDGWEFAGWNGPSLSYLTIDYVGGEEITSGTDYYTRVVWAVYKRTISFQYLSGTGTYSLHTETQYCKYDGSYVSSVSVPSRDNLNNDWSFIGYHPMSSSTFTNSPSYNSSKTTIDPGLTVFYTYYDAIYKKTITIKYNANSGTGSASRTKDIYINSWTDNGDQFGNDINKYSLLSNTDVGIYKSGYTFVKWRYGSTDYSVGDAFQALDTTNSSAKEFEFYAQWIKSYFEIILEYNLNRYYNPSRADLSTSFYTNASPKIYYNFAQTYTANSNESYKYWCKNTNGDNFTSNNIFSGNNIFTNNELIRLGYTFGGFYISTDKDKHNSVNFAVSNFDSGWKQLIDSSGNFVKADNNYIKDQYAGESGDITIYLFAKWTKKSYSVSYNFDTGYLIDSGNKITKSTLYKINNSAVSITVPTSNTPTFSTYLVDDSNNGLNLNSYFSENESKSYFDNISTSGVYISESAFRLVGYIAGSNNLFNTSNPNTTDYYYYKISDKTLKSCTKTGTTNNSSNHPLASITVNATNATPKLEEVLYNSGVTSLYLYAVYEVRGLEISLETEEVKGAISNDGKDLHYNIQKEEGLEAQYGITFPYTNTDKYKSNGTSGTDNFNFIANGGLLKFGDTTSTTQTVAMGSSVTFKIQLSDSTGNKKKTDQFGSPVYINDNPVNAEDSDVNSGYYYFDVLSYRVAVVEFNNFPYKTGVSSFSIGTLKIVFSESGITNCLLNGYSSSYFSTDDKITETGSYTIWFNNNSYTKSDGSTDYYNKITISKLSDKFESISVKVENIYLGNTGSAIDDHNVQLSGTKAFGMKVYATPITETIDSFVITHADSLNNQLNDYITTYSNPDEQKMQFSDENVTSTNKYFYMPNGGYIAVPASKSGYDYTFWVNGYKIITSSTRGSITLTSDVVQNTGDGKSFDFVYYIQEYTGTTDSQRYMAYISIGGKAGDLTNKAVDPVKNTNYPIFENGVRANFGNTEVYFIEPNQSVVATSEKVGKSGEELIASGYYEPNSYLKSIQFANGAGSVSALSLEKTAEKLSANSYYNYQKNSTIYSAGTYSPKIVGLTGKESSVNGFTQFRYNNDTYTIVEVYELGKNTNNRYNLYLGFSISTHKILYILVGNGENSENYKSMLDKTHITFTMEKYNQKIKIDYSVQSSDRLPEDKSNTIHYNNCEVLNTSIKGEIGVSNTYEINNKDTNVFENLTPSSGFIIRLSPQDGYLINSVLLRTGKFNGDSFSEKVTLLNLSLNSTDINITGSDNVSIPTFMHGELGGDNTSLSIGINYDKDNKSNYLLQSYYISDTRKMGIYYATYIGANWSGLSPDYETIYLFISGIYDDVSIEIETISYMEFDFIDSGNVFGRNSQSFLNHTSIAQISGSGYNEFNYYTEVQHGDIYDSNYTYVVKYSDGNYGTYTLNESNWTRNGSGQRVFNTLGSNNGTLYYVKANKDLTLNYTPKAFTQSFKCEYKPIGEKYLYRLVFLGYAEYFKEGIAIFFTGENYSFYLTNASFYHSEYEKTPFNNTSNEVNYGSSPGGSKLTVKTSETSQFKYVSGYNTTSPKCIYYEIRSRGDQNDSLINHFADAFIYRDSATENSPAAETKYFSAKKWVNMFNIVLNSTSMYSTSYIKTNDTYQADNPATKTGTWFNDTTITNIYYSYPHSKDDSTYKNENKKDNWQDVRFIESYDSFGNLVQEIKTTNPDGSDKIEPANILKKEVFGYDIHLEYYIIPGYYLNNIKVTSNIISDGNYSVFVKGQSGYALDSSSNSSFDGSIKTYFDGTGSLKGYTYYFKYDNSESKYDVYLRANTTNNDFATRRENISLLADNFVIDFYSIPYTIYITFDANVNSSTISSSDSLKLYQKQGNNASPIKVGDDFVKSTTVKYTYDTFTTFNEYAEMTGYTFIGWGSEKYYSSSTSAYISRFGTLSGINTWNTISSWTDLSGYFAKGERDNLRDLPNSNKYSSDFYIKDGYFITDTGYKTSQSTRGGHHVQEQNYNFLSTYTLEKFTILSKINENYNSNGWLDKAFVYNINLYGIWKVNTYYVSLNLNDANVDKKNGTSGEKNGSTIANASKKLTNDTFDTWVQVGGSTGLILPELNSSSKFNYKSVSYDLFVIFDTNKWYMLNKSGEGVTPFSIHSTNGAKTSDLFNYGLINNYIEVKNGDVYSSSNTYITGTYKDVSYSFNAADWIYNESSGKYTFNSESGKKIYILRQTEGYYNIVDFTQFIVDRYGYTWLGWFSDKLSNVFEYNDYYSNELDDLYPIKDDSNNNKAVWTTNTYRSGNPDARTDFVTFDYSAYEHYDSTQGKNVGIFDSNNIHELSQYFHLNYYKDPNYYAGKNELGTDIRKQYFGEENDSTDGLYFYVYSISGKFTDDYYNTYYSSSVNTYQKDTSNNDIYIYLTYFDTLLDYNYYKYNYDLTNTNYDFFYYSKYPDNDLSEKVVNTFRYLTLYAYWQTNLYEIDVNMRDSMSAGSIAGASGSSYVTRADSNTFLPAYFDDYELYKRIKTYLPVRVGYDFVGWTFITSGKDVVNIYSDSNYVNLEQYLYLNKNLIFSGDNKVFIYSTANGSRTGDRANSIDTLPQVTEKLGDTDEVHYVYLFAIWSVQSFTINTSLDISGKDLKNLYDYDSQFAMALYGPEDNRTNYLGFNTNNLKQNASLEYTFTDISANLQFVVDFDQNLSTARLIMNGKVSDYTIYDLYATSIGHYFTGWSLKFTDGDTFKFIENNSKPSYDANGKLITALSNNLTFDVIEHSDIENGEIDSLFDLTLYNKLKSLYIDRFVNNNNNNTHSVINVEKPLNEKDYNNHAQNYSYVEFTDSNENSVKNYTTISYSANNSTNFGYFTVSYTNASDSTYYINFGSRKNQQNDIEKYLYFVDKLGNKITVVPFVIVGEATYIANIGDSLLTYDNNNFYYNNYVVNFDDIGAYYVPTTYGFASNGDENVSRLSIQFAVLKQDGSIPSVSDISTYLVGGDNGLNKYINNIRNNNVTFKLTKTRQFTIYADWELKEDLSIKINNQNIGEVPDRFYIPEIIPNDLYNKQSQTANLGLAGYYYIKNNSKSETVETSSQQESSIGMTYDFYDDLYLFIAPYYNGRFLSNISFTFYSYEQKITLATAPPTFSMVKYDLSLKFTWDSINHVITLSTWSLYRQEMGGSGKIEIGTISNGLETESHNNDLDVNNIAILSLLDQTVFMRDTQSKLLEISSYITDLLDYGKFDGSGNPKAYGLVGGNYGISDGRTDVNYIQMRLNDLMSSVSISCEFSVQTYNLEVYNIFDPLGNNIKAAENMEGYYRVSENDFNAFLSNSKTIYLGSGTSSYNVSFPDTVTKTNFYSGSNVATIKQNVTSTSSFNIPYGFYIYGKYYDANTRPVEVNYDPVTGTGYNKSRYTGYDYLYKYGLYEYGDGKSGRIKDNGIDEFSDQCSPILGSKINFVKSVREASALYQFDSWYVPTILEDTFVLQEYDRSHEATMIKNNTTVIGYYYANNKPTNIDFYTWNDNSNSYEKYENNTEEYTLNKSGSTPNFTNDKVELVLKSSAENYVDENGNVLLFNSETLGIDGAGFTAAGYRRKEIAPGEDNEKFLEENVVRNYWYYDFSSTHIYLGNNEIKYDDAGKTIRGENNVESTIHFYYLTNNTLPDTSSNRTYVQVFSTNLNDDVSVTINPNPAKYVIKQVVNQTEYNNEVNNARSRGVTIVDANLVNVQKYHLTGSDMYAYEPASGLDGDGKYYKIHKIEDYLDDEELNEDEKTLLGSFFHYDNNEKPVYADVTARFYAKVHDELYYLIATTASDIYTSTTFYVYDHYTFDDSGAISIINYDANATNKYNVELSTRTQPLKSIAEYFYVNGVLKSDNEINQINDGLTNSEDLLKIKAILQNSDLIKKPIYYTKDTISDTLYYLLPDSFEETAQTYSIQYNYDNYTVTLGGNLRQIKVFDEDIFNNDTDLLEPEKALMQSIFDSERTDKPTYYVKDTTENVIYYLLNELPESNLTTSLFIYIGDDLPQRTFSAELKLFIDAGFVRSTKALEIRNLDYYFMKINDNYYPVKFTELRDGINGEGSLYYNPYSTDNVCNYEIEYTIIYNSSNTEKITTTLNEKNRPVRPISGYASDNTLLDDTDKAVIAGIMSNSSLKKPTYYTKDVDSGTIYYLFMNNFREKETEKKEFLYVLNDAGTDFEIMSNTVYLNYSNKLFYTDSELRSRLVTRTFNFKAYTPVNNNYSVKLSLPTTDVKLDDDVWSYIGVTINSLPSPNIGFWYNNNTYGYVGYVNFTQNDIDYISSTAAASEFQYKTENVYNENGQLVYNPDGTIKTVIVCERIYDVFENYINIVFAGETTAIKEQLYLSAQTQCATYNSISKLKTVLMTANVFFTSSKANSNSVEKVNLIIPITFNLVCDKGVFPATVSVNYKTTIITKETTIDETIFAIPIYSRNVMEFTPDSVTQSSNKIKISVEDMFVNYFENIGNIDTRYYNYDDGNYMEFAILNEQEYKLLKQSQNYPDQLNYLLNSDKYDIYTLNEKTNSIGGWVTEDFDRLENNKFVYDDGYYYIIAYYKKMGEYNYIVRTSDNLIRATVLNGNLISYTIGNYSDFAVSY